MKIEDLLVLTEQELFRYIETQLKKLGVKYITCDDYIVTTQHTANTPLICIHTDTVSKVAPKREDLLVSGNLLALSQNSKAGCLGADDRAGVWIALEMIKRGTATAFNYAFFTGEEIGCIGSTKFATTESLENYSAFIGLDRASRGGVQNVATYLSDNDELIKIFTDLGYKEQAGSYTDCSVLSNYSDLACVNLSVGFQREHTKLESLDVSLMEQTLNVMLNVVIPEKDYEAKPVITKYGKSWPAWEDDEFETYYSGYRRRSTDNILDAEVSEIYPDDGGLIPVTCDFCDQHELLYECNGAMVCRSCLVLVR